MSFHLIKYYRKNQNTIIMTINGNSNAESSMSLKKNETHLWIAECDEGGSSIEALKDILSDVEKKRAKAFHFKRDYRRYTYAHALLRSVISFYTGLHPENIKFSTNNSGKPFLNDKQGIQFNLSHTRDLVAVVISPGVQIGVDVERYKPFTDMDDVASRIMTTIEYLQFLELDKEAKELFFYKCWVRKEAVVKAWGTGIDQNLSKIPVIENLLADSPTVLFPNEKNRLEAWRVEDIELGEDFAGAVCVNSEKFEVKLFQQNMVNQILSGP